MTRKNHIAQTTAHLALSSGPSDFYPLPDCYLKGQYLTKRVLEQLRSLETEDFQFNRALSDYYMKRLDPAVKLPVVDAFFHKQYRGPYASVIRVVITMPKPGRTKPKAKNLVHGIVDMPHDVYDNLPRLAVAA